MELHLVDVLRALKAVGPGGVGQLVEATRFVEWDLVFDESRLDYDASDDRASKRKGLPRIARDMDRCLGRPENDGTGPTMRELLAMARQHAATIAAQPAT